MLGLDLDDVAHDLALLHTRLPDWSAGVNAPGNSEMLDLVKDWGEEDFGALTLYPLEGKQLAFPFDYNPIYLIVRTDLLEEKGLDLPETWDELAEAAKALNDPGKGISGLALPMASGGVGNSFGMYVFYTGGARYLDDEGNVILDSPEMKPKVIESF